MLNRRKSKKFFAILVIASLLSLLVVSTALGHSLNYWERLPIERADKKIPIIRQFGTLTGIVNDAMTSNPIPGVTMTLTYHGIDRIEYTDSDGVYTFPKVPLCYCLKNISASMESYTDQYQLVSVSTMTYANFSLVPLDSQEPLGTILGTVSDAKTMEPLTDVVILLQYHNITQTTTTNTDGQYSFANVSRCECLKNISATKEGYVTQHQLVSVSEKTYVNFTLVPENGGVLMGSVTNAITNESIPSALMTLEYHELTRTTYTDQQGRYTFTNIPICYCLKEITAAKEGYKSENQIIWVSEMTYANFTLLPAITW